MVKTTEHREKTDGWIEKGNDETHAEFHFA